MSFNGWHPNYFARQTPIWNAVESAWRWTFDHCNGKDYRHGGNVGPCPICGERVMVREDCVVDDGRIIGTCGDAFTIEEWENDLDRDL